MTLENPREYLSQVRLWLSQEPDDKVGIGRETLLLILMEAEKAQGLAEQLAEAQRHAQEQKEALRASQSVCGRLGQRIQVLELDAGRAGQGEGR